MATGGWGGLGCHSKEWRCLLAGHDFYVCPRDGRSIGLVHKCGGYNHFFCAAWSCETTGDAYWKPTSSWDKIIVQRGWKKPPRNWDPLHPYAQSCSRKNYGAWNCTNTGYCLPLNISFTAHGKQANGWQQGYTWGLRWYISDYDRGIIFKIKLKIENLTPLPVGPNLVLPDQRAPINSGGPVQNVLTTAPAVSSPTPRPKDSSPDTSANITLSPTTTMPLQPGTGDRLINLIKGAYTALNFSDPNRAKNCWLCLVSSPPYYEGIAINASLLNYTSPPAACNSLPSHKLTLPEVAGQGLCIGKVPPSHKALCNLNYNITTGPYYLKGPNGTYWACSTGLTPCIQAQVLNTTADFCVLVQLWPRITYHSSETILDHYEEEKRLRYRREPITLTIATLLGVGGIAAGIGTGASALLQSNQLMHLQAAMTADLEAIEKSITALEKSLTSLSEVVLQNRRGLDLLFLKEGGLCAALKEECCFYADHTGVVRETMDKLRERLAQRKRDFESQQGWFESWFTRSPWFTTLISTLMGPLIILLLILSIGPYVINRLVQFTKDRLSVIQAMVLTQQYQLLKRSESRTSLEQEQDEWI